MQYSDPATGFMTGTDEPDLDVMRYATQVVQKRQQPQAEMRAVPQTPLEKIVGAFGRGTESLGKTLAEPFADTQKVAPIKTWLAKSLITDPLQGAGTALQDWSGTPRDVTPEHPYTPSPFYGGSKATLNPQTWGPALQTFKTDPRMLDVAGVAQPVGALTKAAAKKVVAPAARMAGEAMAQRMLSGESMIPGVPQAVAPSPLMFAVKPERGGNWLNNNAVEFATGKLKPTGPTHRDEALILGGEWPAFVATPEGKTFMENNAALHNWVDKKLAPYIKNDMGTPNDPVRLAHKRGYSHIPGDPVGEFGTWVPDDVVTARRKAGLPEEGVSVKEHAEAGYPEANQPNVYKAEMWENISDAEITSRRAGEFQDEIQTARDHPSLRAKSGTVALEVARKNPWLEKVSRDTPIYNLQNANDLPSNLGLDHLIDELKNALDPTSGLPQNLRLTPKQLDKVTMEQAVERVSKINDWRADQAAKAEREGMMSNLQASSRLEVPDAKLSFVDKPGMKWIDVPETTDKNGLKLCTTLGKQGGWCTQGESLAKSYGSGENRLTTLIDAEGRPHAQAKIAQQPEEMRKSDFLISLNHHQYDEYLAKPKEEQLKIYTEWAKNNPAQKPDITELKPVGNAFSSERAREYAKRDPAYQSKVTDSVLKFLNSGEWGKVNDLHHYDIFDLTDPKSLRRGLDEVFGDESGRLDRKFVDMFNAAVHDNPNAPRFVTHSGLRNFVEPPVKEHRMLQGFYRGYAGENPDVPELFASPQKRIADYYARKRAAQTGEAPHAEMILADPFAGKTYGHATAGTGANPPMETRAKKLKKEDIKGRTQLYAKGGSVHFAKSTDDMRYELTRKK